LDFVSKSKPVKLESLLLEVWHFGDVLQADLLLLGSCTADSTNYIGEFGGFDQRMADSRAEFRVDCVFMFGVVYGRAPSAVQRIRLSLSDIRSASLVRPVLLISI
jgi:hypothetical protein